MMTRETLANAAPPGNHSSWMSWRSASALILATLLARLIYLYALSPYELAGDEAYYWVQSQHLDWSYHEKGPLLAWAIAVCTKLLGSHEWVVRLPMALSAAGSAWAVGRLAMALANGKQSAGFLAVVMFLLTPAFNANAQICTQDGPLTLLIIGFTAVGLRIVRRWRANQRDYTGWMLFWLLMGVGILLKQSALLFWTAFPIYCLVRRTTFRWSWAMLGEQCAGIAIFAVVISPILIWESRHGWPMWEHTLGHLGFSGDRPGWRPKGNALLWIGNTVGSLMGAIGPVLALMVWASVRAIRNRRGNDAEWADRLWILCAGWPSVMFFVLLSATKPAVPSWPLPCTVPLVALTATLLIESCQTSRIWLAGWWTTVLYGGAALVVILFPTWLVHLPGVGVKLQKSMLARISGHRALAEQVNIALAHWEPALSSPVIVTPGYQRASLLSFYLPTPHPVVTTAASVLGVRSNNFDTWSDTSIQSPAMIGRTLLIADANGASWANFVRFDRIVPAAEGSGCYIGINYQGGRDHKVSRMEVEEK